MQILILTPQLPYPPRQGTTIRNFNLIAQLAARHEVHLLTFVESEGQLAEAAPLREHCASIRTVVAPGRPLSARRLRGRRRRRSLSRRRRLRQRHLGG